MNETIPLPRVTVAIATFNRPGLLAQTLQTILAQDYPADRWEVFVVDNNSPPATRAVVESFHQHTPTPRWILETTQGVSNARNHAIREAHGDIIVFADDDVLAEPDWLRKMVSLFRDTGGKGVGAVGGTVLPVFPEGCPPWWEYTHPLRLTEQPAPLPVGEERKLMGASLAVSMAAIRNVGGFRADLGRLGTALLDGEEPELMTRVRQAGYEIWFATDAVVRHQMPRSRLTLRYACRNAYDSACARVIGKSRDRAVSKFDRFTHLLSRFATNAVAAPVWWILTAICWLLWQRDAARKFLVRGCRSAGYVSQILKLIVGSTPKAGRI